MVKSLSELGRRERQIMDIVVRRGRATAADVLADLPDPPSYSSVRGMLRLLEEKGYVSHQWDGPRYVYLPGDPARLRRDAIRHFVKTFFNDSTEDAVVALLGPNGKSMTREELARLGAIIEQAKKGGRT
ncbi:MAG TPA: BlaI/MecI/CopY family transcriptional regulator [Gemmatimonadaceae bacterium]|jgi:predicted transcriptional regulator